MKVWLIGLGLALLCSVHAEDDFEDQTIRQMTGKWYAIGLATNCGFLLDYKDYMKIMVTNIEFTDDGYLQISVNVPLPGGCQKFSTNFRITESGQYIHKSADWGDSTVEDFEMDYNNWLAVKTKHETKSETCETIMLYSRDLEMSNEEKDSFTNFCVNHGFNKDDIIIMPPKVACAESQ